LGVAARYADRSHPWVERILADPDVADLNVHTDPSDFLQKTVECEAVVSSSLHGLIFAEALKIPNLWIKLSDKVLGEGFKFRDWFSLADFPQEEPELPSNKDTAKNLAARTILHGMRIDQESLIGSFPFAGT
jgi:pyruvyltransferase